MIRVLLTKIKTRDGITLDGIYVKPKRKGDTALIWVHGLGSRFYSGQGTILELSSALSKQRIAYLNFNTRGHDTVNRDGHGKKKEQGRAFERFEDCVWDIHAMAREAKRLGYKNIILAGHSTGANKVLYYLYKTKDRRIKGLALVAGLSDISAIAKEIGIRELKRRVRIVEGLARKNPNGLVPEQFGTFSRARYLSLLQPGRNEDTFPYHGLGGSWKALRTIRQPIAVIIGSHDEYLDRSPEKLIETFERNARKTKKFDGFIIKNAGHNFVKKEKELAGAVVKWIKSLYERSY